MSETATEYEALLARAAPYLTHGLPVLRGDRPAAAVAPAAVWVDDERLRIAAEPYLRGWALPDLEHRRYDPAQRRDPHSGEWTDAGGGILEAAKDALDLAGRIDLDRREQLISSSRIRDKSGHDHDLVFAVVASPGYQNEVRIGVVSSEDSGRWRAADLGATAILNVEQVRRFRDDLAAADTMARPLAEAADKAWRQADPNVSVVPVPGEDFVTSGVVRTDWADLHYNVYLDDGDPTSWQTTITAYRAGDPEPDGIMLDPRELRKLLSHLDDIAGQLA